MRLRGDSICGTSDWLLCGMLPLQNKGYKVNPWTRMLHHFRLICFIRNQLKLTWFTLIALERSLASMYVHHVLFEFRSILERFSTQRTQLSMCLGLMHFHVNTSIKLEKKIDLCASPACVANYVNLQQRCLLWELSLADIADEFLTGVDSGTNTVVMNSQFWLRATTKKTIHLMWILK